jgi:hemerythrin
MATTKPNPRWRPALKLGVKGIDKQHKSLISSAAGLQDAIASHQPKQEVAALFDALVALVRSHFAWEERAMESRGYEGYIDHKKAHDILLDQIRDLHREFLAGEVNAGPGVALFLQVWAEHHIAGTDKPLAEFLLKSSAPRKKSPKKKS